MLNKIVRQTHLRNLKQYSSSATATVFVGSKLSELIQKNAVPKGDVLGVSKIGGIMAGKRAASHLIPFVYNVPISSVNVSTNLNVITNEVIVRATIDCNNGLLNDQNTIAAEALTSVILTSLSIYYMGKKITHDIQIRNVSLDHGI